MAIWTCPVLSPRTFLLGRRKNVWIHWHVLFALNYLAERVREDDLEKRAMKFVLQDFLDKQKEYESDLSKVPGRILNRHMVPVFHLEMNLLEERIEMVQYVENGSRGRSMFTDFIGDAELKNVMSDCYNAYVFIGDVLKTADEKVRRWRLPTIASSVR